MITVLSPAKTLDMNKVELDLEKTIPRFLDNAEELIEELRELEVHDISKLMKVSEDLSVLNFMRYKEWKKEKSGEEKQAILAFKGEAYRGLKADGFSKEDLEFANKHLRILSGLYGVLKPLDGIKPYRLEMGIKLKVGVNKNLYEYWGDTLSNSLLEELEFHKDNNIINLASEEYFKAVGLNSGYNVVTPIFKERKGLELKVISVYAKKARGLMCNYIIKNRIDSLEALKKFNEEGYEFSEEYSNMNNFVFIR